jgi:hypothetical protein
MTDVERLVTYASAPSPRPIPQRLGDVPHRHVDTGFQIRDRARDAQHAMVPRADSLSDSIALASSDRAS